MHSLAITVPCSDPSLLTIEQLRAVAGVSGAGQDEALRELEKAVAASIVADCRVAVGEGAEPTLRRETLTETFYGVSREVLKLARRHNIAITSIEADGSLLDSADYFVNSEAGLLTRLSADRPIRWCGAKIIVVYGAGFETVPSDLKQAATDYFRMLWTTSERDPMVKSESVETVGIETVSRDYWVGGLPGQSGGLPAHIAAQLSRYRNLVTP